MEPCRVWKMFTPDRSCRGNPAEAVHPDSFSKSVSSCFSVAYFQRGLNQLKISLRKLGPSDNGAVMKCMVLPQHPLGPTPCLRLHEKKKKKETFVPA